MGEYKHSLDAKAIENTLLPGRNFMSLVEQIPGFQNVPCTGSSNNPTNSTGSYAAFSGRTATFQIDGVNNDDSSENQNRSATRAFSRPPGWSLRPRPFVVGDCCSAEPDRA